ncbi:hypothetical protein F5141DRAFT_1062498 [Pisolithus sp. B1]|nr:hypothetical protein F5141DRAFT_1062498 [Pisolithus sp. B1]
MHLSDVMELLNFWKEHQESHPNDIFAFQKWLDQAGNLQLPSDGSTLPLQIAKKQTTQSQKAPISADESNDNQNDNTGTEDEATSAINIVPVSSRGKSRDTHCLHKKTPIPVRQPTHLATDDEEQHEVISTEDEVVGNEALPVVKQPSTSRQSTIQHKGSRVTAELPDANGYMDDDKFDSMPFADVHTTHSGPSGQHQKGGKLKSALKGHSRCEQKDMNAQPNLETRRNPQQSMAKATKRCRAANNHPGAQGPSTEGVTFLLGRWSGPGMAQLPHCMGWHRAASSLGFQPIA